MDLLLEVTRCWRTPVPSTRFTKGMTGLCGLLLAVQFVLLLLNPGGKCYWIGLVLSVAVFYALVARQVGGYIQGTPDQFPAADDRVRFAVGNLLIWTTAAATVLALVWGLMGQLR